MVWSLVACLFIGVQPIMADTSSGLVTPRFVSVRSDEVNVRAGPGQRYPIEWVFKHDGMPVEIIREFGAWREIKDKDGDAGWIHKSLLSGKRFIIIDSHITTLYEKNSIKSRPVVNLEAGVIALLEKCKDNWCLIKVSGYKGWLKKSEVWGVYPDEDVK